MEMVGVERFELPALWSQTRCATRLRYTPTLLYYPHYSYFSSLLRMQKRFYLIFIFIFMGLACSLISRRFMATASVRLAAPPFWPQRRH